MTFAFGRLEIGSQNNGSFLGGYVKRVTLWSANRISNAGLQALTT